MKAMRRNQFSSGEKDMVPGLDASLGLSTMHERHVGFERPTAHRGRRRKKKKKKKKKKMMMMIGRGGGGGGRGSMFDRLKRHTSDDLWTLKILVRMDVAWLESHVQANQQQC